MFNTQATLYNNISLPKLIEHAIARQEGLLGTRGELLCTSGSFTGRSPKDKFFVDEQSSRSNIDWGKVNQPLTKNAFQILNDNVRKHMQQRDVYVVDGICGADPQYQRTIRFITEKAWHAHFVRNMFIRPTKQVHSTTTPDFTIINASTYYEENFKALGLHSSTFIAFDISAGLGLIGGTEYAGEMKKGIFSIMNYLLPLQGVLPMHCSANMGASGDVALFFGLSGTGKTTLSADPNRRLIGDDEHGWSKNGVFNFEGGCYAKTINLSEQREPEIWDAIRFGAILENVVHDCSSRIVDFSDSSISENTRVSYPIEYIDNYEPSGRGGHPSSIIFLTCDAFGVLPPVARLTPEQASYHFLSGYTAKVAGTERGVTEPQATFSTCFGGPFMTLAPQVYGDLLAKNMCKHRVPAYLVNTGWSGGSYGVGKRIALSQTRAIIETILNGEIQQASFNKDDVFGFEYATQLRGVDSTILSPQTTWSDPSAYTAQKKHIAHMFVDNFTKFSANNSTLCQAGPRLM